MRDCTGSIAPIFAVAAIPLTIAVGAATDIGRTMDVRSQMQDMSDSAALAGATQFTQASNAAAVTIAENFITASIKTLPGAPTPVVTASCAAPTAGAVGTVSANVCDLGDSTSGTTITAQIKVMTASNVATTFAALVTPSVAVSTQSVAQGNIGRNVVFTLTNYNSSASDTDQIYYYSIPSTSVPASSASNSALLAYYTWTPWTTPPAANLLLSNTSGFSNVSKTVQIPLGTAVGFALSNTTGTSNCYGQAMGVTKVYYSHREDANGNYWDIAPIKFNVCTTDTSSITNYNSYLTTDSNGNNLLMPCNKSSTKCLSSATYNSSGTLANYVYYTDVSGAYKSKTSITDIPYNRNPLRFASTNTDCTQGDVQYQWDDNGGNPDDNDYNDDDFTVNCSTTGSDKSSIRLVS
ncbi:MAG: pilus assembly protein TadG-related protein [Caulobacteraceae bacterium]